MATAQPLPQLHTHIGIPPAGQEGAERAGRNWDCRRLRPPQHRRALRGQSGVRARGRGARPPHSPLTAPPPPAPPQRRPRPSSAPRRVPGPAPLLPVTPRYPSAAAAPSRAEPGPWQRLRAAPHGAPPGAPRSPPPLPPPAPLLRHRRGGRCLAQKPAGVTKPRAARRNQSAPRPRSRLGGERHVTGAGLSPPCPPPYLPAAPAGGGVREQDGGGDGGAPRSRLRVAVSAALRRPLLPPPLPPPPGEVPGAVPGSGAAHPQPPSQGHPHAAAAAPPARRGGQPLSQVSSSSRTLSCRFPYGHLPKWLQRLGKLGRLPR